MEEDAKTLKGHIDQQTLLLVKIHNIQYIGLVREAEALPTAFLPLEREEIMTISKEKKTL